MGRDEEFTLRLLVGSLKDERDMLLGKVATKDAHIGALRLALQQISAIATVSVARARKNENLLEIARRAEEALLL